MKFTIILSFVMLTANIIAAPLDSNFLHSINMVEASGKQGDIHGDHGKALGGYQIHKSFWKDAVEYDKTIGGSYSDVTNKEYAEKVVTAYLNRYAKKAVEAHDYKALAYAFHRGDDNAKYWLRVKTNLEKTTHR